MVEHDLAKVGVAGSNPVSRSKESKDPQETESIHIGSVFFVPRVLCGARSPIATIAFNCWE